MLVVTLPARASDQPAAYARRAAEAGAELLEVRGDLTPDLVAFESPLPLLVSPRGAGRGIVDRLQPSWVDLEEGEEVEPPVGARLIRSFHDYDATPEAASLIDRARRLAATGAQVVKIATTIRRYGDLLVLDRVRSSLPPEVGRAVLGMGARAAAGRALSPWRDTLTYACLDGVDASAPGQLPLASYRRLHGDQEPQLFGILGSLKMKSASPLIHDALFERKGFSGIYLAFPSDDLDDAWEALSELGLRGYSVTSPFKEAVVARLDRLGPIAEELGVVNTIVREGEDWAGYQRDSLGISEGYPFLAGAEEVAIVGSGGVVPAVIRACRDHDVGHITLYARNTDALSGLVDRFAVEAEGLESLSSARPSILIWTLPVDAEIALPAAIADAQAIDLRYGPNLGFLDAARRCGYQTHDGWPMLLRQALAQFTLFTGLETDAADYRAIEEATAEHGRQ